MKVLRDLVIGQTWKPAAIRKGDTFWFSDAAEAPLSDASACSPRSGDVWLPFGAVPAATAKSTAGLMKPSLVSYPAKCGVTVHLNEQPAESEDDRVTSVRIQVLDLKVMNEFVSKHQQR